MPLLLQYRKHTFSTEQGKKSKFHSPWSEAAVRRLSLPAQPFPHTASRAWPLTVYSCITQILWQGLDHVCIKRPSWCWPITSPVNTQGHTPASWRAQIFVSDKEMPSWKLRQSEKPARITEQCCLPFACISAQCIFGRPQGMISCASEISLH